MDAETLTHYEDKEAESVYLTYSPDNLKTRLLRQTPEGHDELKTTDEIHTDDQDGDATAGKSR